MKKLSLHKNSFQIVEVSIISFFWILLLLSPLFAGQYEDDTNWKHIFSIWREYLPIFLIFLLNRFLLMPKLLFRNKRGIYFLSLILLILVSSLGLSYYNQAQKNLPNQRSQIIRVRDMPNPPLHLQHKGNPEMAPRMHPRAPQNKMQNAPMRRPALPRPLPPQLNFIVMSILFIGFDIALRMTAKWIQSEQEKVAMEKENVESQLAFLKNQVSPHFFMNTLNNIHALIDFDAEGAKDSVIKLSNLMRYLLYESEAKQNPIEKEIAFICSYVELMRLRYTEKVKINLSLPENAPSVSIPPLLFTSLLENAFKHGISYSKESFIDIRLAVVDKEIHFDIQNSNNKQKETNGNDSGIGIENTKRHLALLYKNNYQLAFDESPSVYSVHLSIPI